MNTMMEVASQDHSQHSLPPTFAPSATRYRIKRSGGRPLVFEGTELAMAMSYSAEMPFWYEVNFYRTVDQQFVTAIKLFHQSEDKQDTVKAWQCSSLEEATSRLTGYDAAHDVQIGMDFDLLTTPPAETAANALQLAARIAEFRHHFQSLVGEFLFDLEQGAAD